MPTDPSAPRTPTGLDFDMVQVGRPCIQPRALALTNLVHHQVQYRRKFLGTGAYQVDQSELATPTRDTSASIPGHRWRFLAGRNTRAVRCTVLIWGAKTTGGSLQLISTTDGTGTEFAFAGDALDPAGVVAENKITIHTATVAVTPNTVESVSIEQNSGTALIRILSATLVEHPLETVDLTDDAVSINPDNFAPGTPIIDTTAGGGAGAEYSTLAAGVQDLRRFHKKLLYCSLKEVQTTASTSVLRQELHTRSTGNPPASLLQFDIDPSVNLPQTSGNAVTCAVLARATGAANLGNVRFDFVGTNIDVTGIGAIAVYTGTGSINKSSESLSLQGWNDGVVTPVLFVYGAWVWEDSEAV